MTHEQIEKRREAKLRVRAQIAELRASRPPSTRVKVLLTADDVDAIGEIERLASESMGPPLAPGEYEVTLDSVDNGMIDNKAVTGPVTIDSQKPDFTLTAVRASGMNDHGFWIDWATVSAGFGQLRLYLKEGTLRCSSEAMSRDFVKAVLAKLADEVPLDEEERWLEEKRRLLDAEGGCVSAADAEEIGIPLEVLQGCAFGVQTDEGLWMYPRWQVGLEGFRQVLAVLEAGDADPWTIMTFFVDDEVDASGTTALEALRKGDVETVLRAARALGNQGAT